MTRRCLLLLTLCLVSAVLARAGDEAFTIAVVRRDGILIPFATYDGKRWRSHWPSPRDRVDVPISLRSIPPGWWGPIPAIDTWQVTAGDGPPRVVRVRQPDWFETQCQKQIGLRTDYRPADAAPEPDAQPYPKDGLAISSPREVLHIDIVPPRDPPSQLVAQFNIQEREAIDGRQSQSQWSHWLTRQQREATPLKIEATYAAGPPDARAYYFEASRQYPSAPSAPNHSECVGLSYGAGWFVAQDDVMRPIGFRVAMTSCNR